LILQYSSRSLREGANKLRHHRLPPALYLSHSYHYSNPYAMTSEISAALSALETLSSSTSTSSSGPLNALLETHFIQAKNSIIAGDNPRAVITELQKNVVKAKKDVEKGLKAWYGALGNIGKAVDSVRLVKVIGGNVLNCRDSQLR
jgi:hypothetical protein